MKNACPNCESASPAENETEVPIDEGRPSGNVDAGTESGDSKILVEVICERVHCVMYDYAITTVDVVGEEFEDRITIKPLVRRGDRQAAERYLEVCRQNDRHLPVPTILFDGEVAFTDVPTPDELRTALRRKLAEVDSAESAKSKT